MTTLLHQAFDQADKLSPELQDQLAALLLEGIKSEDRWNSAFHKSEDKLAELARKARAEFLAGRTEQKGFDQL